MGRFNQFEKLKSGIQEIDRAIKNDAKEMALYKLNILRNAYAKKKKDPYYGIYFKATDQNYLSLDSQALLALIRHYERVVKRNS